MANKQYALDPKYDAMTEDGLVECCRKGEPGAFNVLIGRYENRVLSQTVRYLQDYQAALDEAQEIFLKVFNKIKLFKGDSSFSTWLYRVTANHCLNVIKKRKQKKFHLSFEESREIAGDAFAEDKLGKSADELIAEKQVQAAMHTAIASLPADQQQVIILRHYEEMRYDEIASLMDVPVTTVCSCLHRARQQLRRLINRKGGLRK